MKQTTKRLLSIWVALVMLFSAIPSSVMADDPSATTQYDGILAQVTGAITPLQILGDAVNYGIVANRLKQKGHTETNFAVKKFYYDQYGHKQ